MIADRCDMAVLKPFRIGAREPWRLNVWHGVALLGSYGDVATRQKLSRQRRAEIAAAYRK